MSCRQTSHLLRTKADECFCVFSLSLFHIMTVSKELHCFSWNWHCLYVIITLTGPSGWHDLIKSRWALFLFHGRHNSNKLTVKFIFLFILSWDRRGIILWSWLATLFSLIMLKWWAKYTDQKLILIHNMSLEPRSVSAAGTIKLRSVVNLLVLDSFNIHYFTKLLT